MTGALSFVLAFSRVARGIATKDTMDPATPNVGGNTATISDSGSASPSTFAEAFAADASPASTPGDTSTTPPAAAQPGTETPDLPQQADDPRSPFIPRPRFDEVNTKLAEIKAWKEQHAWAETPGIREAVEMIARSKGDPLTFFREQFAEMSAHPQYGPQLRSFLGQQFAGLRARESAEPQPPSPDVAIYDDQGQVVGHTYSDKALAARDAFREQQLLTKLKESLAPEFQTLGTIVQEREKAAADAQAQTFAASFMEELQALPGFADHKAAIAEELRALRLPPNAPVEAVNFAAYRAYTKHALPHLGKRAESHLLDRLQTQAHASTVNPSSAAPTSRTAVKSFADLPPDAWR
jgi:hypothetical protein